MNMMTPDPAMAANDARRRAGLARLIQFYETLSPESVADVADIYSPDASFKDPFNEVRGHAAIRHIFEHMFENLEQPRFQVVNRLLDGDQAMLEWVFEFRLRGRGIMVRGASMLCLDGEGCVVLHRDYWDPLEELLVKLPLVGLAARHVRRKLSAERGG